MQHIQKSNKIASSPETREEGKKKEDSFDHKLLDKSASRGWITEIFSNCTAKSIPTVEGPRRDKNPFTMTKASTGSNKRVKNHRSQPYRLSLQTQKVPFCPIVWIGTNKRIKGQTISTKCSEFGSSQVLPRSLSCRKVTVPSDSAMCQRTCSKKPNTETGLSFLHCIATEISVSCQRDHKQKVISQFHQYLMMWRGACTNYKYNCCSWLNVSFVFYLPQTWRPQQ